ncbi:MAG: hypothetical protein K2X11_05500 [Acetobacteraceae bacterium]|nr:hypothetical protein [Acetobacteraceae bacterium]
MRIKLPLLALAAGVALMGCTDQYGRVDAGRTALLGAGLGAAAGLGVAAASNSSQLRYVEQRSYGRPRGYGYYDRPYRGW